MMKSQDNMAHALDQLTSAIKKSQISLNLGGGNKMDASMVEGPNEEKDDEEGESKEGDDDEVEAEGEEELGKKNKKRKLK